MNSEEVFGNPAQFGLAAPSGVEPCTRKALTTTARSAHSRRRVRFLLRRGRRGLRLRGRDGQEPGPSCPRAALHAALHRQRRHVRPGPHHPCRSDRQRACLTRSSVCWRLLLLSETVWISPTCEPVKPHGRPFSDFRRRSLRVAAKRDLPLCSGIAMIPPPRPAFAGGKGSPCEKEKGRPP